MRDMEREKSERRGVEDEGHPVEEKPRPERDVGDKRPRVLNGRHLPRRHHGYLDEDASEDIREDTEEEYQPLHLSLLL